MEQYLHHSYVSPLSPSSPELANESRVRKLAGRRGYRVIKSRRQLSCDNQGEFMLADDRNHIVLGSQFDASLEEIETYLREL